MILYRLFISFSKGDENENFDENVRDWGERYGDQRGKVSGGDNEEEVEARRLRWAVYGREVVDDAKLFESEMYGNGDGARGRGRTKLFTKEERNLLNGKWLPLHSLAASGNFILLTSLLKHVDEINAKDQQGLTALHKAIISKQQSITTCPLRESANPLVRDNDGATLLHYADGWTPLHLAVQARQTDIVRFLLTSGAYKTLKNKCGVDEVVDGVALHYD
ncbi:Ankyrin repeat domain-containing protein [Drosera capensis]